MEAQIDPFDQAIDVVLRIGAVFLSCGAPTADVQSAVFVVGDRLGLVGLEVDINYSSITISVPAQQSRPGRTAIRVVRDWHINYARLVAAHQLVRELAAANPGVSATSDRLREVERTGSGAAGWRVTLAWGVLAAAIVASLGGDVLTSAIAFGSAVLVDLLGRVLGRHGVPAFFVNAASALVASMVAVALTAADSSAPSALVIAGGIMALLPGMSVVVAAQEAIGRFPVTAGARIIELSTATAGIVVGVLAALLIADRLSITMVVAQRFASERGLVAVAVVSAGVAAGASAVANRSPSAMLLPAAITGALGVAVLRVAAQVVENEGAALTAAAIVVGLVGHVLSLWRSVPAVLVIVPGIIPLLPGLAVYRGLLEFSQGRTTTGTRDLIEAATIAVALASGVLLGEMIAKAPVRAPAY